MSEQPAFRSLRAVAVSALLGFVVCSAARAASPQADAVFINGKVFTANEKKSTAQAFAVRDGRFLAVGSDKDVRSHAGPQTKVIDLRGRFVAPGLTDAHFHGEGGGSGVDLSRVKTLAELLAAIAEAARKGAPGEVIITNGDWHEMQLRERRLPVAKELDAIAPNHPVVVVRGGHSYILNTQALRKWNVTKDLPDPPGGRIGKDAQGELTGELIDTAKSSVKLPPPPLATLDDFRKSQRVLNSFGITAVRVPGGGKADSVTMWRMLNQLKSQGELTVRYNILLRGFGPDPLNAIDAAGFKQDQGDDWVRIGGIKLGVDGGFEGGHMLEPYAEPYGENGTYRGVVTVPPDRYTAIVKALNQRGWRIATHAAGDAAVEQVLSAYEAANVEKSIVGKRWAIEHAFLSTSEQRARAKALGLTLSVQNHLFVAGPAFKLYLGQPRAERITPLKTYLDAGLDVALGTDAPVIPVNPFWELYHYVTRDTRSDGIYGENERVLDRATLLRVMSMGFADLVQSPATVGSIEAGKLADFVVMSGDFLSLPAASIRDLKAVATYVEGKEVYRDSSLQ